MRLSILGATGSVGQSTLDVVETAGDGAFDIVALTANQNVEALAAAARNHRAEIAVVADPNRYEDLVNALFGSGIEVAAGPAGLDEAADREVDCVMAAIVGAAGLRPTLAAARRTRRIAIANKECLVISGSLFLDVLAQCGTEVVPVDSEHAAVFQVVEGREPGSIERIILTASGGPFRTWTLEQIASATLTDALKHPNWTMGAKITIDSATMMNKGLELIEAHHLFGLDSTKFDAIIHPQSLVHCLVEFCDGSLITQVAAPDMRTPIAQSLYWPNRQDEPKRRFDLAQLHNLQFEPIDVEKFPAFGLARSAMQRGGAAPAVLNGANEAAVAAFLSESIDFLDIATTVSETMNRAEALGWFEPCANIDAALKIDDEARNLARDVMVTLRK